jgi:tRNA(fMet)-specific endonuclease VapC
MKFVLDTSAFSMLMRRDDHTFSFLKKRRPGDFAIVPPVMAEIEYGIKRLDKASRKYELLNREKNRLFSIFRALPWTAEASVIFGDIKADLEKSGRLIDDFDIAIAAIAKAHHCAVMTANTRHFSRIKNLHCISCTVD